MLSNQELLQKVANWPDPAFHTLTAERISQLEAELAALDFRGIALAGPARVDMDQAAGVPVVLWRTVSTLRQWQVRPQLNQQIVIVDRQTGDVQARDLFHAGKRRMSSVVEGSMQGTRPDDDEADDGNSSVQPVDLRELFGLAPLARRVSVRLMYFDMLSNPVSLDLVSRTIRAPLPPLAAVRKLSLVIPERVAFGATVPAQASVRLEEPASPGTTVKLRLLAAQLDRTAAQIAVVDAIVGDSKVEAVASFDLRQLVRLEDGKYQTYLFAGDNVSLPQALTVGSGVTPTGARR